MRQKHGTAVHLLQTNTKFTDERSKMSAITQEQSARVGKFMTEFWKDVVKPYYNPPSQSDDAYWSELPQKISEVCKKCGVEDDLRVQKLTVGFATAVDNISKGNTEEKMYEYMHKSDDFIDALNRLFKWFKEGDEIFKDLQSAFRSAHKVKLADGSLQAARVTGEANGKQA